MVTRFRAGIAYTTTRCATLVVAASDSSTRSQNTADYLCTGENDEATINTALDALPSGGGRLILMEGTYIVDPSSASIILDDNETLEGQGPNTVIKIADNINSTPENVIENSDQVNGNSGIRIRNLKIDGNKANQVAGDNHRGIYLDGECSQILIHRVHIVDLIGGTGILIGSVIQESFDIIISECYSDGIDTRFLTATGGVGVYYIERGIVVNNIIENTNNDAVMLSACQHWIFAGNSIDSAGANGLLADRSRECIFSANTIRDCSSSGIQQARSADWGMIAIGNSCFSNTIMGINANGVDDSIIFGNVCNQNAANNTTSGGIGAYGDRMIVAFNVVKDNQSAGIRANLFSDSLLIGNVIHSNSQSVDDTYDNIHVTNNSDDSAILFNTIRHGGGAKQPKYGILVADAPVPQTDNLWYCNNDMKNAGKTADFFDNRSPGDGTTSATGNRT